jgi:hypothetical protein
MKNTAFSCHKGHSNFTKMAFGLNNAPATYQRRMDYILVGLKGTDCLAYLDFLICYSATMDEHVCKLKGIFERLEQVGFKIESRKCVFATVSVEYLRRIVTRLELYQTQVRSIHLRITCAKNSSRYYISYRPNQLLKAARSQHLSLGSKQRMYLSSARRSSRQPLTG